MTELLPEPYGRQPLTTTPVFIFDAGAGTNPAVNHMRVPYHKANKSSITHYPIDHIADLLAYHDFGRYNGRLEPMNVYGPTGELPELGINALVENLLFVAAWHDGSERGQVDVRGFDNPAHIQAKDGANHDPSVMHGVSKWLDDSIIPVPEIEAFQKELAAKGMRWAARAFRESKRARR